MQKVKAKYIYIYIYILNVIEYTVIMPHLSFQKDKIKKYLGSESHSFGGGGGRDEISKNKICGKYDIKKNDIVGFMNPFFLHKQSNIAWMNK